MHSSMPWRVCPWTFVARCLRFIQCKYGLSKARHHVEELTGHDSARRVLSADRDETGEAAPPQGANPTIAEIMVAQAVNMAAADAMA